MKGQDVASNARLVSSKYRGSAKKQILATLAVCLGSLSFGYSLGYTSPAVPELEWRGILTSNQLAWFSSLLNIGGIIGSFAVGHLLDSLGRKKTIMLTTIPFISGWIMIAFAKGTVNFYIGRILTGIGSGVISGSVSVYITEIATSDMRGTLGCCNQLFITIGILAAYSGGLLMDWKMLAGFGTMFPISLGLAMYLLPETPRWLLIHATRSEAKSSLSWLRGRHTDVEDELKDIEESIDQKDTTMAFSDFCRPELKMPLKITVLVQLLQQLSGINAVMFYSVSIMLNGGFKQSGVVAATVIGVVQVVATVFSVYAMDRLGRRILLTVSGTVMGCSCFVFGYNFHTGDEIHPWVPLTCVVMYIIGFSLGWGPVPALIMSELYPVKARSKACSITTFVMWSASFVVTKEFDTLIFYLSKAGVFWIFGSFSFVGVAFVLKYLPETKGKSLEDIELYFLGRAMRST